MIHEPRKQLHRQVFEGESRPVEEFQHEQTWIELSERRDGRMTKGAIGFARHARKIRLRNSAADKGANDLDGHFSVGLSGETFDCGARPNVGHVSGT